MQGVHLHEKKKNVYILKNIIYTKIPQKCKLIYGYRKQNSGCLEMGEGMEKQERWGRKDHKLPGSMNMIILDCGDGFTGVHSQNIHIIHFIHANF